jgi:hypothetical protein
MGTPHRRLFRSVSSLFDGGASMVQSPPPLDPKTSEISRNYLKLSWKSTTCVNWALILIDPNRIAGGLICHRFPLTSYPKLSKSGRA